MLYIPLHKALLRTTAGQTWAPLEFQFKPGDVSRAPRLTGFPGFPGSFPGMHQPRLDWQMWFAALGSYQVP